MQELMVYAGHLECYAKCHQVLERFLSVEVSSSQIYRVTDFISESLQDQDECTERLLTAVESSEVLYAQVDGSMVLTREQGWKEVKLARLFKSSDCLNPGSESAYLTASQYICHLGPAKEFCCRLERGIDAYGQLKKRLVFITDGATWIKNWIEDSYSDSIAILDYYHACEHLYKFAETCHWQDSLSRQQWCDRQKELLLESQIRQVIENIGKLPAKDKEKQELINYYQNNIKRMDYKYYRTLGCGIIGSGAIESAHRTVIQKRMKLSGQHWSSHGAQNMLRLRVISMNKQWYKVIQVLRKTG